MLKRLLNWLRPPKPDEATYPDRLVFLEGELAKPEPEITDDGLVDEISYNMDTDRLNIMIAKRADLRRRKKAATHLDAEMMEIRARMLAYENGRMK